MTDDTNSESSKESDDFYSMEDESDIEMKSLLDPTETMSVSSAISEEPDSYDLQFNIKEEKNILAKIKGYTISILI